MTRDGRVTSIAFWRRGSGKGRRSDGYVRRPVESVQLQEFVNIVGDHFCPFIHAAYNAGVLYFHEYSIGELERFGGGDAVAGLFNAAIIHTERLRDERLRYDAVDDRARSTLICDNLVVAGSENFNWRSAKNVVDWPHYILKNMYSSCGLMFGKFWTREEDEGLDGRPIPPPQVTFLSIRSVVKLRDPLLLREQTDFANLIRDGKDIGADVLHEKIGITRGEISTELLSLGRVFFELRNSLQADLVQ